MSNIYTDRPLLVTIVMPIYNRASFIEKALSSIVSQDYTHWELIIVDDGSTDETYTTLEKEKSKIIQKCELLKQANSGPAIARNNGILKAEGDLIAFFDSDDEWEHNHLSSAVQQFITETDLDWVYFACKRVSQNENLILQDSTFYSNGSPNALFKIVTKKNGNLNILNNEKSIIEQLGDGIDSGLQNSVIRKRVFDRILLPEFRIGEDRLFILLALKAGFKIGFVDKVTVIYNVHDGNTSDTNANSQDIQKRAKALLLYIDAVQAVTNFVSLSENEMKVHKNKLFSLYVWQLGYSIYSQGGQEKKAIGAYIKGWKLYPFKISIYKILLKSFIKIILLKS